MKKLRPSFKYAYKTTIKFILCILFCMILLLIPTCLGVIFNDNVIYTILMVYLGFFVDIFIVMFFVDYFDIC